MLARRDHWIFDLDGTLTVAVHDFDAIRVALGLPRGEPILELLAALDPAEAAPLRRRLDEIELELARAARAADGAHDLLAALRSRGARVGILTRNSHHNALETLARCGLQGHFSPTDVIARDHGPLKPNPAGVHALLRAWRAAPSSAVMVGDYLYDLQAGRNAGTATVYVDVSGEFPFAEHADLSVRNLAELLAHATATPRDPTRTG